MIQNLYTVWLDYNKALDSILRKWLLYAMKRTKVPDHLIAAISHGIPNSTSMDRGHCHHRFEQN